MTPQMLGMVLKAGTAVLALWGLTLPAFLLIWFARRSVKEETLRWES
jgi:hypothetical protein